MASSYQNCAFIPRRWIVIFTCFLGLLNAYTMRICLSIAITQMVAQKNHTVQYSDDTCPEEIETGRYRNESFVNGGKFDWSEKTQGLILSSFYWGYLITSLLGGIILDKLGGKHTMGLSILLTSVLTLLLPKSVELGGSTLLVVLRLLTGVGEGAIHPAVMRLMGRWIPQDERSLASACAYSGMSVGTIAAMAGSGIIIHRSNIGWPMVFYVYGSLGILSFFIHCIFCYDSPNEHPFISKVEAKFLMEKLKHSQGDLPPTPWQHIIRSKPIWVLLVALIGKGWCLFMLLSDMPKFVSSVLKFNVETNGFASSLPHACAWIFSCAASWIADHVIAKKIASIGCVRKIGSTVAMVGVTTFLLIATYVGCNRTLVIGFHVIAMMLFSCANFSIMVGALDLAPSYAGSIQGVLLGIGTITGFLSPYVVGLLTPNQTIDEWRVVFWLMFVISTISNVVFVIFSKAEVQEWNDPNFLMHERIRTNNPIKENIQLLSMK